MATNKRKESAALFELIDKSTLKVPKNASALKIPNWWSSKSNPAATAVAPGGAPRTRSQAAVAASMAPLVKSPVGVKSPPAPVPPVESPAADMPALRLAPLVDAEPQDEAPPAQSRLFDPPPPHVAPASSPSIRPPSANGQPVMATLAADLIPEIAEDLPVTPAPVGPTSVSDEAPAAAAGETAAPVLQPAPLAEPPRGVVPAAPPALPPTKPAARTPASASSPRTPASAARIFAPQTYSQDRKPWSSPRPGAFARLPAWALLTAVASILILICIVVLIAKTVGNAPAAVAPTRTNLPATGPSVAIGLGNVQPPAPAPATAHIYAGGTVPYKPELYYIIICSTSAQATANEYAAHLQKNDIDVAIETTPAPGNKLQFTLVATQGFPSASLAKTYRDHIVRIGDALSRGIWKDANPQKGLSGVPATGR